MTLAAVLRENARSCPAQPAVVCGHSRLTHTDLASRVSRLVSVLASLGVQKGDRIAWLGHNCHRWLECLAAAGDLGGMLVSLNWRQPAKDLADVLRDLQPKVVVWQQEDCAQLAGAVQQEFDSARWICHDSPAPDGYEGLLAAASTYAGEVELDPNASVLVLSVSDPDGGTNGSMLSHTNLLVPGLLMSKLQEIDAKTVHLVSAPLFHIAALFGLIPTIQMRGINVFVRRADATLVCRAIADNKCTHGLLFAPTIRDIIDKRGENSDLSSFRSGIDLPGWQGLVSRDSSPWGRHNGGYGQTETNMAVLAALTDGASNTSGRTAPYAEVRIVDADYRDVPADSVGAIMVRGQSVHQGYWRRPAINARRFLQGWWHTRDLGKRDENGIVTFIGPMGRMIKAGAENIFGAEVERCILQHPAVSEVAIIGLPDQDWVQSVCAIVVTKTQASVTEADLIEHCRANLASYKKPRTVIFRVDSLPRVGLAIDYAKLDVTYGGGNYPGEGTRSV